MHDNISLCSMKCTYYKYVCAFYAHVRKENIFILELLFMTQQQQKQNGGSIQIASYIKLLGQYLKIFWYVFLRTPSQ